MQEDDKNKSDSVKLFSALVVQGALERDVIPLFERESKVLVQSRMDPTTVLVRSIMDGDIADVLIAIDGNMDDLEKLGILSAASRVPLVKSSVGLAVRTGDAVPAIKTLEQFKAALLGARSVAYSRAGASGIYFVKVLEQLGIAEQINARATVIAKGLTAETLISGEADLAVQQLSELSTVPGVSIVGPFPDEVQSTTSFSAALFADAVNKPAAKDLLMALHSDAALAAYASYGLDVLRSGSDR